MRKLIAFLGMVLILGQTATSQCTADNQAFKAGESLSYKLYFNWRFIWITAGSASMTIKDTSYENEPVYQCDLITKTNKRIDKFFVMRDTLVSIVSQEMAPLYYRKGALEGNRYQVDEVWYSYPEGKSKITQRYKNHLNEVSITEQTSAECIYDMLSMLLRARSFDASKYKINQKIKFLMADGGKVKNETLIYRGKEEFTIDETEETFRCLVFSFVEYKKGKEKEVVTFYITDDANHLPVRLDMYLNFGSAKAFLTNHKGVRSPMTSLIAKKQRK